MVEAKKCARCGTMYIAESDVCGKCQKKDGADLYRLKGVLEQGFGGTTQGELSIATGISNKNLARFLGYDEFKGVLGNQKSVAAAGKTEGQEVGEELV